MTIDRSPGAAPPVGQGEEGKVDQRRDPTLLACQSTGIVLDRVNHGQRSSDTRSLSQDTVTCSQKAGWSLARRSSAALPTEV